MRAERFYGALLIRAANHRAGRWLVARAHENAGRAVGAVVDKLVDDREDALGISRHTMERYFLPILESDSRDDAEGWSFELTRCPYGLTDASEGPLCHAIMKLEESIVHELGGELLIEARIAEGAERCRFRVRSVGRL